MKPLVSPKRIPSSYAKKILVVFDLDGTLTESKAPMDAEMATLLVNLLRKKRVAVIGGGRYALFKEQLIAPLEGHPRELFRNLFLFPTTSTAFYRYHHGWKNVYIHRFYSGERAKIKRAFREVLREAGYTPPQKVYGKIIEDRGTQVTFSALGQDIVARLGVKEGVRRKEEWRRKYTPLKMKIARLLAKRLPNLEVRAAGFTSIDVTKKGIDKSYGLRQIEKYMHVPIKEMLFVGDALFRGGNDYAARLTGVDCVAVRGPEDAKTVIRRLVEPRVR